MAKLECPYCKNEKEVDSDSYGDEDEELGGYCESCDKQYTYTTHYTIELEAQKLKDNENR